MNVFSELMTVPFYFISFQTLCKTHDEEYLPAEIAIIEYSIEKGITKNLHRFIEPGRCSLTLKHTELVKWTSLNLNVEKSNVHF